MTLRLGKETTRSEEVRTGGSMERWPRQSSGPTRRQSEAQEGRVVLGAYLGGEEVVRCILQARMLI